MAGAYFDNPWWNQRLPVLFSCIHNFLTWKKNICSNMASKAAEKQRSDYFSKWLEIPVQRWVRGPVTEWIFLRVTIYERRLSQYRRFSTISIDTTGLVLVNICPYFTIARHSENMTFAKLWISETAQGLIGMIPIFRSVFSNHDSNIIGRKWESFVLRLGHFSWTIIFM